MIQASMENVDGDLGYIKLYIQEIHAFLSSGNKLDQENIVKVKQSHELIQSVFCSVSFGVKK